MSDRVATALAGAFTALGIIGLALGDTEGRLIGLTAIVLFGGGALVVRASRTEPELPPGAGTQQPAWLVRARRRHLLPSLVVGLALVVGAILVFPVVDGRPNATAGVWGATAAGALLLLRSAHVLVQVGGASDDDAP